jgi:hypothetical protein
VAGCCEYGDEPAGYGDKELVAASFKVVYRQIKILRCISKSNETKGRDTLQRNVQDLFINT